MNHGVGGRWRCITRSGLFAAEPGSTAQRQVAASAERKYCCRARPGTCPARLHSCATSPESTTRYRSCGPVRRPGQSQRDGPVAPRFRRAGTIRDVPESRAERMGMPGGNASVPAFADPLGPRIFQFAPGSIAHVPGDSQTWAHRPHFCPRVPGCPGRRSRS